MSDIQERVQDVVDRALEAGTEDGVQVTVIRDGEVLADVAGGVADRRSGRPMTADTPCYAGSALKAVTATVVHVLADRGELEYDTRVAEVWPEFGARGKEGVTLRHVLTHSAGVPAVPADTTPEDLCDWAKICGTIADLEPWWAPGERVGYHAVTFGYILGEVVRRVTGKPISQVLAEEIAGPLGVPGELYYGVPRDQLERVAHLQDEPAAREMFTQLPDGFPLFKAAPRAVMPSPALANRRDTMTSDQPFHGYATARAMARTLAALMTPVDGLRLISPTRLIEATTLATAGLTDEMSMGPATWALGYGVGGPGGAEAAPTESTTLFGMVGMGGGAAYADRRTRVAYAVTKNRFDPIRIDIVEQIGSLVTESLT
jgi:CubicO group peptidase (beta-lactamase class C family)